MQAETIRLHRQVLALTTLFAFGCIATAVKGQETRSAKVVVPTVTNTAIDETVEYVFERSTFQVSRHRGHVYFGDYWYAKPLSEQETYVRLIETFDGLNFDTNAEFFDWARKLRGKRTYTYDSVAQIRGGKTTVLGPLVLLPEEKRSKIDPHWRTWRFDEDHKQRQREEQRRRYEARKSRYEAEIAYSRRLAQIATKSANSLAVIAGETALWEVELIPTESNSAWTTNSSISLFGGYGIGSGTSQSSRGPIYVRSYGRNSYAAGQAALAGYNSYQIGSIRKLSN
jgi:hypothetical protein